MAVLQSGSPEARLGMCCSQPALPNEGVSLRNKAGGFAVIKRGPTSRLIKAIRTALSSLSGHRPIVTRIAEGDQAEKESILESGTIFYMVQDLC